MRCTLEPIWRACLFAYLTEFDYTLPLINTITPLIITHNEAANIGRTLEKLMWADRIIVIDSGSVDGTLDIIARYSQVAVFTRNFDSFAAQCNFGLTKMDTEWALSLDADYELSDQLVEEISELREGADVAGYRAAFVYRIYGRPLRGTLYPPRVVLYRVKNAHYRDEGHGHRVVVSGRVCGLNGVVYHDDRKPLSRWVESQQRYARVESSYLLTTDRKRFSTFDRLRWLGWPAPIVAFFYVLLVKRCLLDGWPGWFYALQRLTAECIIALELIDRRLGIGSPNDSRDR